MLLLFVLLACFKLNNKDSFILGSTKILNAYNLLSALFILKYCMVTFVNEMAKAVFVFC